MNKKRKEALNKLNTMKTFGTLISEARDNLGVSKSFLSDKISERKIYVSEKEITAWEKDRKYPDITIIYILAEILKINPTDLLEAKQLFQEAGLNVVDMMTMRVICRLIDISIMGVVYLNRILFFVFLIVTLLIVWGRNIK